MKVYVSSLPENELMPEVLAALRAASHECFLARDIPEPEPAVSNTSSIHDVLGEIFARTDFEQLEQVEALLIVQPCGSNALLELGVAIGRKIRTLVLAPDGTLRSHVFQMADRVCLSVEEIVRELSGEPVPEEPQSVPW